MLSKTTDLQILGPITRCSFMSNSRYKTERVLPMNILIISIGVYRKHFCFTIISALLYIYNFNILWYWYRYQSKYQPILGINGVSTSISPNAGNSISQSFDIIPLLQWQATNMKFTLQHKYPSSSSLPAFL